MKPTINKIISIRAAHPEFCSLPEVLREWKQMKRGKLVQVRNAMSEIFDL